MSAEREYMESLCKATAEAKERLEKQRQAALVLAISLLTEEIKQQAVDYAQAHGEYSFVRNIAENKKYGTYTIDETLLKEVQSMLTSQYLFSFKFRKQYNYWLVEVGWPERQKGFIPPDQTKY